MHGDYLARYAPEGVLVDLRSEKEYALGHIPGAVNIPILNNEERHHVGTTYVQTSSQEAVSLGLELFAKKAESFLAAIEALTKGGSRPLSIYCWRGGMRSELPRLWLTSCGFAVHKLPGGYKQYRRSTLELLETSIAEKSFVVLNGHTGVGKTEIIQECQRRGLPALDLEGMARHRGSLFGGMAQKHPPATQQEFENYLALGFAALGAAPKIILEIEGAIGPVLVPLALQRKLRASPMVYLEASLETRVAHLVAIYTENWDQEEFDKALAQCQRFLSKEQFAEITRAVAEGNFPAATALLLRERYDKAYKKGLDKHLQRRVAAFNLPEEREELFAYLKTNVLPQSR